MDAKKCDRCGRFYTCYNGKVSFLEHTQVDEITYNHQETYDLCKGCVDKFMDFIQYYDKSDENKK